MDKFAFDAWHLKVICVFVSGLVSDNSSRTLSLLFAGYNVEIILMLTQDCLTHSEKWLSPDFYKVLFVCML